MKLQVNGKTMELPANANIIDLLTAMQLTEKAVAVEVNQMIVPRSLHAGHQLQADDQIEIVHAIGGG